MYAASTERMIEAMGIGFLDAVPRMFISIAVAAWCAARFGWFRGFWAGRAGGSAMTFSAPGLRAGFIVTNSLAIRHVAFEVRHPRSRLGPIRHRPCYLDGWSRIWSMSIPPPRTWSWCWAAPSVST